MANNYGIRYLIVGVGTLDDKAEQDDVDAIREFMESRLAPDLTIAELNDRLSDKLTVILLQESGAI
jgi:hypothetical protein